MKIKDLISQLQQYDQNLEICIKCYKNNTQTNNSWLEKVQVVYSQAAEENQKQKQVLIID